MNLFDINTNDFKCTNGHTLKYVETLPNASVTCDICKISMG